MTTTAMNELLELSQGYIISKLVMLAAKWKLDELLGEGTKTVQQLAQILHCHPDALYRYLRVLAAYHVVALSPEREVKPTPLTAYLNRLLCPQILDSYRVFEDVEHTIKMNEPSWSETYQKAFYPYLIADPEKYKMFETWCSRTAEDWLPVVISLYNFQKFKTIVDVGGGQGDLLIRLLQKNNVQTGIVFDRPEVISKAKDHLPESLRSRIQLQGGSFFESVPSGGDLYIICRTLLNWNDQDAIKIINHCYDAMMPGAILLVLDFVVPDATHPHYKRGTLNDMNLFTALNSAHRNEEEWRHLITQTKFKLNYFKMTDHHAMPEPYIPMCTIEMVR